MAYLHSDREFFEFCLERHRIYLRRLAGQPWPWTEDKILRAYKFTNVYRELDRVTVWLHRNWREPYAEHQNLAFAMCVARFINRPETLEFMGFPEIWNPEQSARKLNERKAKGHSIYTPAYMIRAETTPGREAYDDKQLYVCKVVLGPIWKDRLHFEKLTTIQETTEWLSSHYGWGGFMSYEVASDLRHTRYLSGAPDALTWANPGPGAHRGLNRVCRGDVGCGGGNALEDMRQLLAISRERWPNNNEYPPWEMREVEHCLCEFDKYERVRLGQGRPKQVYRPLLSLPDGRV